MESEGGGGGCSWIVGSSKRTDSKVLSVEGIDEVVEGRMRVREVERERVVELFDLVGALYIAENSGGRWDRRMSTRFM